MDEKGVQYCPYLAKAELLHTISTVQANICFFFPKWSTPYGLIRTRYLNCSQNGRNHPHHPTPDENHFRFIKEIADKIAVPLGFIFNLSFMRAEISERWKEAYVTPFPKNRLTPILVSLDLLVLPHLSHESSKKL